MALAGSSWSTPFRESPCVAGRSRIITLAQGAAAVAPPLCAARYAYFSTRPRARRSAAGLTTSPRAARRAPQPRFGGPLSAAAPRLPPMPLVALLCAAQRAREARCQRTRAARTPN